MLKVVFFPLIILFLLVARPVKAEELCAAAILQEIHKKGARRVIDRFWDEDLKQWEKLENSIASGTTGWLEVATLLRAESDAGASEGLDYAVSLALTKNPVGVLTLLKTQPDHFTLDWICRDPYLEDADPVTEEKFLRDAENALAQMYDPKQDKELDALRWQCLEGIRRDLKTVEKEKDKSGLREMPITSPPSAMPTR